MVARHVARGPAFGVTSRRPRAFSAADDHSSPPRIELNVVFWSERNQLSRDLSAAGALSAVAGIGSGLVGPNKRMIVDYAVVLDASGQRIFRQHVDAPGGIGNDEASAGGAAGSRILTQIFRQQSAAVD